jgi:acyloxyacyl hydrolase
VHTLIACVTMVVLVEEARAGGGAKCAACGIVVGLLEEKKTTSSLEVGLAVDLLCGKACSKGLKKSAEEMIKNQTSPDYVCGAAVMNICTGNCSLFPTWPLPSLPPKPHQDPKNKRRRLDYLKILAKKELSKTHPYRSLDDFNFEDSFFGLVKMLTQIINPGEVRDPYLNDGFLTAQIEIRARTNTAEHPCGLNISCIKHRFLDMHWPVSDDDGDVFASVQNRGLRGSHWRGADCNDKDANIYPGRNVPATNDPSVDHDCNGIFGSNASGTYEDLFCSHTERRGLIHIGDSATAHFHLPPQWLTANGWNIHNVYDDALDELDQPGCAWGTGFKNASDCPYAPNKVRGTSLAGRLRERNLCNHRDFQNIGVNGARTTAMAPLVQSAARDSTLDHKVLVIYSPIGNDVCNGHPGTSHMTPPATFRKNVFEQMKMLNGKLPSGSYVLLVGLVDGRVLWNHLHNHTHPLGSKYEDVYGLLNCAGCNPCHGWLNKNETLRNATTAWAQSLNAQYEVILNTAATDFPNLKLHYVDPQWGVMINKYVASGGKASDLIEPSDGFHPSQLGNELLAGLLWEYLEQHFPEAIGRVNPFNAEIMQKFGDQGGF